jgi:hypothetical protein
MNTIHDTGGAEGSSATPNAVENLMIVGAETIICAIYIGTKYPNPENAIQTGKGMIVAGVAVSNVSATA